MLDVFYQNPMAWVAFVFACMGAFGFGVFVVGFFAGLPHLFTLSGDDYYLERRRLRATWGVLIMVHAFILWEIVRYVASWFGGPSVDPGLVGGLLIAYVVAFIVLFILFGITRTVTGGD